MQRKNNSLYIGLNVGMRRSVGSDFLTDQQVYFGFSPTHKKEQKCFLVCVHFYFLRPAFICLLNLFMEYFNILDLEKELRSLLNAFIEHF